MSNRRKSENGKAICPVAECGKFRHAGGLCDTHYRQKKYGRKQRGPQSTRRGDLLSWLETNVLTASKDECLIWPFGRTHDGYGNKLRLPNGIRMSPHRWVAVWRFGGCQDRTLQVLHSCGNGRLGCVNPHHLRWGTAKENSMDTVLHGRTTRGERNSHAKLAAPQIAEIKRMLADGFSQVHIAAKFKISTRTVRGVKRGDVWGWVKTCGATNCVGGEAKNG